MATPPLEPAASADGPLVDLANAGLRRAYCGRLADFIIDHIGKPYDAEECGSVLEVCTHPWWNDEPVLEL